LAAWLKAILGIYAERVLVLDAEAALHARALILKARAAGKMVGFADLTVACIARARGLGPVVN
jgi:toxin FitB